MCLQKLVTTLYNPIVFRFAIIARTGFYFGFKLASFTERTIGGSISRRKGIMKRHNCQFCCQSCYFKRALSLSLLCCRGESYYVKLDHVNGCWHAFRSINYQFLMLEHRVCMCIVVFSSRGR